jgi:hypothetical protein
MPDGRVEIITGKERRRRWSVEEKLRHEVYPSLLFNWRRQVREGRLGPRCLPQFVPVHLISISQRPPHLRCVSQRRTGVARAVLRSVCRTGHVYI